MVQTLLRPTALLVLLLGAVAVLYGFTQVVEAAQKWGLPEAEWAPLINVVEGTTASMYGGALIALAVGGVRSRPRVGALWVGGAGSMATAVGLYLRSWSELAAVMNLTVGVAALVVTALVLIFARGRQTRDGA